MSHFSHPVSPIRSFTTRAATHYPSRRTLRTSDHDGPKDDIEEDSPTTHNITKSIAKLEDLVKQITELAQDVKTTDSTADTKRKPSDGVVAKGWQYLNGVRWTEKPEESVKKVAFRSMDDDDIEGQRSVHHHEAGPKAVVAPPELSVTKAEEESISAITRGLGDAETFTKKLYLKNNPIPPLRRSGHTKGDRSKLAVQSKSGDQSDTNKLKTPEMGHEKHFTRMFGIRQNSSIFHYRSSETSASRMVNLKKVNHVDLWNKPDDFDVHVSCDHASVARNWPESRKRFAATVVCVNSTCIGLLIGVYSGEVPAIQYVIADFHHYAILGNVFLYCGLATSTFLLWPLPLLHGRKVYTVAGLALAFGLQIPQGIVVTQFRQPDEVWWRVILLLSRALTGLVLGLVSVNTFATLLDLFGASLQSSNPHGELADPYDVRRHGGGMGMWLAAWSWCKIGTIGVGFVLGAFIIDHASVEWGFWASLFLLMSVLLLNLLSPEVRRSAFRRTIAEFVGAEGPFSRVTRGEIKMHLDETGPY